MITIFYYIHNNLNNILYHSTHHEAERIVTVSTTSSVVKVENTCISTIVIVTAAHFLITKNIIKFFPKLKLT